MQLEINPTNTLHAQIEVPGDKSITHRAIMLASLAEGTSIIDGFLDSEDCASTAKCFKDMGVSISRAPHPVSQRQAMVITGKGMRLSQPKDPLYVVNSGTTMRLLLGILAGQKFETLITGDESIKRRPMLRVVDPLRKMGASIHGRDGGNFAPIEIRGGQLAPIDFEMPVPSAQVKSCIMLAALFAEGASTINEPVLSRDHTERMFSYFDVRYSKDNGLISVLGTKNIFARNLSIPGDMSSAAFFMVAASIVPGAHIIIKNVGINPTRRGVIDVLTKMGADIQVENESLHCQEPRADISVRYSGLKGIEIGGSIIPNIIDEIPVLTIAAAAAKGTTTIKDARELRVKESDRLSTMGENLKKLGVKIEERQDGMLIEGGATFSGGVFDSHGDHRVAMSIAIAGLIAKEKVIIENTECIATSFPGFEKLLLQVSR